LPWHASFMRTAIGLDWAKRTLTSTSGKNFIKRTIKIIVPSTNEIFEIDSLELLNERHKDFGWRAEHARKLEAEANKRYVKRRRAKNKEANGNEEEIGLSTVEEIL
jgi:hypothetical protein